MTKRDDAEIDLPVLTEAQVRLDTTAASELGVIFPQDSLTDVMGKVAALEAFLSATCRDTGFSEFIHEILISIIQIVKSEAGTIFEVDPTNNTLFFRAVLGSSSDKVVNFEIPVGQGIVGHVVETKAPLAVDNVPENAVHLKAIESFVGFETRNLVAVPIMIRGKVYGVLELLNRIGEASFSSSDVKLLSYLCNMAAKFIEIRLMIAWSRKNQSQTQESDHTNQGKAAA